MSLIIGAIISVTIGFFLKWSFYQSISFAYLFGIHALIYFKD